MRLRAALLAFAIAGGAAAAGSAAPAAAAPTPFALVVTCDEATNRITTATTGSGALVGDMPVRAEISFVSGTAVPTAPDGTVAAVPAIAPVSLTTRTGSNGSLPMTGYTRTWQGGAYAFYTETARISVYTPAGQLILTRDGTCTKDPRTTGALEYDPVANTMTARTTGAGYTQRETANGPATTHVRVAYRITTYSQATKDGPRFVGHNASGYPDHEHTAPVTAGTWSDLGYVRQLRSTPGWYYAEDVVVTVTSRLTGRVLGRARLFQAIGPGAA